jgi:5'-nucleotidase
MASDSRPLILLSNDDGIDSRGIAVLEEAVREMGEVFVVAPENERSAASHALTLHKPLRIYERSPRHFAVSGTPTDCVNLAIFTILPRKPDFLLSGINHGANMADDVTYSGTVSAAFEGSILGVPSMAFSLTVPEDPSRPLAFETARHFVSLLVRRMMESAPASSVLFSVNIPDRPLSGVAGIRVTRLGKRVFGSGDIIRKEDPRGRPYYWIGLSPKDYEPDPQSDLHAVDHGYVSVTPLHLDLTHYPSLSRFRSWEETEEPSRSQGFGAHPFSP